MTKEEFCKELKESQEKGILAVCSIGQQYINSLEAENERLEREVNRLEANEELLAEEQVKILDERDGLREENAKLRYALARFCI